MRYATIVTVKRKQPTDLDLLDIAVPKQIILKLAVTVPVGGVVTGPRCRHVVVLREQKLREEKEQNLHRVTYSLGFSMNACKNSLLSVFGEYLSSERGTLA